MSFVIQFCCVLYHHRRHLCFFLSSVIYYLISTNGSRLYVWEWFWFIWGKPTDEYCDFEQASDRIRHTLLFVPFSLPLSNEFIMCIFFLYVVIWKINSTKHETTTGQRGMQFVFGYLFERALTVIVNKLPRIKELSENYFFQQKLNKKKRRQSDTSGQCEWDSNIDKNYRRNLLFLWHDVEILQNVL